MPAGRPNELTPDVIAEVARILPTCLYLETVSDYLGIARLTFRRWLKRGARELRRLRRGSPPRDEEAIYAQFCTAVKRAMAEGEMRDLEIIEKAAQQFWQAAAWRRERRHPKKWALRDRMAQEVQTQLQQLLDRQGLVELDKIRELWRGTLQAIRDNVTDGALLNAIIHDVLKAIPAGTRAVLPYRRPASNNGTSEGGEPPNG
jgi:hypothetical protein